MAQGTACASQAGFFTVQHPADYWPDWAGFYASAATARARLIADVGHELHVPYGPDAQQILNIYRPPTAANAPVLLFFHGGRWREGHPDFYDYLGRIWVESGVIFVSAGYRKTPTHTMADCCDDAVAAVRWVQREIAARGGDPTRLVVGGHSSGGHITAMATLTPWAERTGAGLGELLGGVYMSAPVEFGWMSDLGEAERRELTPLGKIDRAPRHVVVSYGDPEPNRKLDDDRFLTREGQKLVAALADRNVIEVAMPNTDHVASAAVLGDRSTRLFQVLHGFLGA